MEMHSEHKLAPIHTHIYIYTRTHLHTHHTHINIYDTGGNGDAQQVRTGPLLPVGKGMLK